MEQKPVTFGKICKVAVARWPLFLAVALGVSAAGTLALHFGYNRAKGNYISSFSYNSGDLNQNYYADGSPFFYSSIISKDNFKRIVEENENLKSINIDAMFKSNRISLTKSEQKDEKEIAKYTLTIPQKFFSSFDQAEEFFLKVTNIPIEYDKSILKTENFDSNLRSFDTANTFENQISFLKGQANTLTTSYQKIIENQDISKSAQATMEANIVSITNIVGEKGVILNGLLYTVNDHGYVKDYSSDEAKSFDETIASLEKEKSLNEAKITALKDELNSITTSVVLNKIDETLNELIQRNVDIQVEIDTINKKKDHEGTTDPTYLANKEAFANTLVSYRNKLSSCTDDYVSVLKKLYVDDADVSYEYSSVISSKGNLSLPISIALSLVAGVIVGGITNLIVDRKKLFE